jgi:hypothetical protein
VGKKRASQEQLQTKPEQNAMSATNTATAAATKPANFPGQPAAGRVDGQFVTARK